MPTLFWQLLLCAVLVFNGITIIIRKMKSGVSLTEQYNKEKWFILITIILLLIIIPLIILL